MVSACPPQRQRTRVRTSAKETEYPKASPLFWRKTLAHFFLVVKAMTSLKSLIPLRTELDPARNQSGQALAEYLILMILVCLVSIAAVRSVGGTIEDKVRGIGRHLESVHLPSS